MTLDDVRTDWCHEHGGVKWRLTLEEARGLADRCEAAENALRSIAKIKCRCDGYTGPCRCGSNAIEMAGEVIGCTTCFATGQRLVDLSRVKCDDCDGTGIRP